MVKRLPCPVNTGPWWIILVPFCSMPPPRPGAWHLIHEYTYPAIWGIPRFTILSAAPSQARAHLAALDYAANSQIVTDLCSLTHGTQYWYFNGPLIPRWNIYHAQRGEPLIPAIYWDIFNPNPPPGYIYRYP